MGAGARLGEDKGGENGEEVAVSRVPRSVSKRRDC